MSVPVEISDREALGDGEEPLVTTDGDRACRSVENINASRDLALLESQPGMVSDRVPGCPRILGLKVRAGIDDKKKRISCWSDQKVKKALGLR
jgi:hypothetical protein